MGAGKSLKTGFAEAERLQANKAINLFTSGLFKHGRIFFLGPIIDVHPGQGSRQFAMGNSRSMTSKKKTLCGNNTMIRLYSNTDSGESLLYKG